MSSKIDHKISSKVTDFYSEGMERMDFKTSNILAALRAWKGERIGLDQRRLSRFSASLLGPCTVLGNQERKYPTPFLEPVKQIITRTVERSSQNG